MDVSQVRTWLKNFFANYDIPISVDDDGKTLNKPIYAEAFLDSGHVQNSYGGQRKQVISTIDINIYSSRPYDVSALKEAIMALKDTDIPTVTIEGITFRRIAQTPSYNQWNIGIDVSYLI
jgi:hypothetical protein